MPRKYEHWDEKTLTTSGVAYILKKVSGKVLLAVGVIRDLGKEPLRLWKEYDGDGVILRGMMPAVSAEQDGYLTSEDYRKFLKMLEDIAIIFERIEAVHDTLAGMAKSITEIRTELAEIEERLTTLDGEVEDINSTLDKIESQINDIGKLIDSAEENIEALREGADDCINEVEASGENGIELTPYRNGQSVEIKGVANDATRTEAGMMTQQDKLELDELWEKYQAGEFGCDCGTITYDDPVVSLTYPTAGADDTSLEPDYSYSQQRYVDGVPDAEPITSGGDLNFTIADKADDVEINASTGMLSFNKNESTEERTLGKVTVSVTMSGKMGYSEEQTVKQEGGEEPEPEPGITYNEPTVRLYYDTIDAEGGTSSPHLTVTQTYTDENGEMHTVDGLLYSAGYSLLSSDYGATINAANGRVTMGSENETYEERTVAVVECKVTANGKETTVTANVTQEAKEYGITPDSVRVAVIPPEIDFNNATYKVNAELRVYKDGENVDTFQLDDDDIDEKLAYNHIALVWGWEGNDEPLSNYTDSDVGDKLVSDYVEFDTSAGTVRLFFTISYANSNVPLGDVTLNITNINRQEESYGHNSAGLEWQARG